jgi:hypothetical protein
MAKISDATFHGNSGKAYGFQVWPMNQAFNGVGAVYAVTRRYQSSEGGFKHEIIYVGETEDLSERFGNHHKANCFARKDANCICTHLDGDSDSRLAKEDDLIQKHVPHCNDRISSPTTGER